MNSPMAVLAPADGRCRGFCAQVVRGWGFISRRIRYAVANEVGEQSCLPLSGAPALAVRDGLHFTWRWAA